MALPSQPAWFGFAWLGFDKNLVQVDSALEGQEIDKWLQQLILSKPVRIPDYHQLKEPAPIAPNDPIDKNDPVYKPLVKSQLPNLKVSEDVEKHQQLSLSHY